jgi:hypothetical protein
VEESSERSLRVEVRLTTDTARGFESAVMIAEPATAEALVRAWLRDVGGSGEPRLVTQQSRHGHGGCG